MLLLDQWEMRQKQRLYRNASSSHGSCPLVFDAEEQVIEVVLVSSTSKETNLTRKRKRAAGEEYSSQKTNKTVEKRQWKKITCKCRFFSCRSISEEEIQKSFSDYWELGRLHGNMHTQKQFILQHVVKRSTKRKMERQIGEQVHSIIF